MIVQIQWFTTDYSQTRDDSDSHLYLKAIHNETWVSRYPFSMVPRQKASLPRAIAFFKVSFVFSYQCADEIFVRQLQLYPKHEDAPRIYRFNFSKNKIRSTFYPRPSEPRIHKSVRKYKKMKNFALCVILLIITCITELAHQRYVHNQVVRSLHEWSQLIVSPYYTTSQSLIVRIIIRLFRILWISIDYLQTRGDCDWYWYSKAIHNKRAKRCYIFSTSC